MRISNQNHSTSKPILMDRKDLSTTQAMGLVPLIFKYFPPEQINYSLEVGFIDTDAVLRYLRSISFSLQEWKGNTYLVDPAPECGGSCIEEYNAKIEASVIRMVSVVHDLMTPDEILHFFDSFDEFTEVPSDMLKELISLADDRSVIPLKVLVPYADESILLEQLDQRSEEMDSDALGILLHTRKESGIEEYLLNNLEELCKAFCIEDIIELRYNHSIDSLSIKDLLCTLIVTHTDFIDFIHRKPAYPELFTKYEEMHGMKVALDDIGSARIMLMRSSSTIEEAELSGAFSYYQSLPTFNLWAYLREKGIQWGLDSRKTTCKKNTKAVCDLLEILDADPDLH